MHQIHVKKTYDTFAGDGAETIIADDANIILAHTQRWDTPGVIEYAWRPTLVGSHVDQLPDDWQPLSGHDLENAQSWADDVLGA